LFKSFTKLLEDKCPEYVRLSVHPSSGAEKLSVPLLVQENGGFPKTPWHCTVAVAINGSYLAVHSKEVRGTHNLVFRDGQPYFYREKSTLWDWDDLAVDFEPQYPAGLLVRPQRQQVVTLGQIHIDKLRQLARLYRGSISVVGFSNSVDVFPVLDGGSKSNLL
jgi:hypothetical protein